jgi:hypothetical protein
MGGVVGACLDISEQSEVTKVAGGESHAPGGVPDPTMHGVRETGVQQAISCLALLATSAYMHASCPA